MILYEESILTACMQLVTGVQACARGVHFTERRAGPGSGGGADAFC
jgi:hypothetical protein